MTVPGTTLDRLTAALSGRYTIVREIGAGGMATVHPGSRSHWLLGAPPVARPDSQPTAVILNWFGELKTKVAQ